MVPGHAGGPARRLRVRAPHAGAEVSIPPRLTRVRRAVPCCAQIVCMTIMLIGATLFAYYMGECSGGASSASPPSWVGTRYGIQVMPAGVALVSPVVPPGHNL